MIRGLSLRGAQRRSNLDDRTRRDDPASLAMTASRKSPDGINSTREWAIGELRRMVLDALGDHEAEVWLFGSCARGEVMQHSDIDIAVLPRTDLPPEFFSTLAEQIE